MNIRGDRDERTRRTADRTGEAPGAGRARLGQARDETSYAKDAWALPHSGVELAWRDQPGGQPANGYVMMGAPEAGLWQNTAGNAVHPRWASG